MKSVESLKVERSKKLGTTELFCAAIWVVSNAINIKRVDSVFMASQIVLFIQSLRYKVKFISVIKNHFSEPENQIKPIQQ